MQNTPFLAGERDNRGSACVGERIERMISLIPSVTLSAPLYPSSCTSETRRKYLRKKQIRIEENIDDFKTSLKSNDIQAGLPYSKRLSTSYSNTGSVNSPIITFGNERRSHQGEIKSPYINENDTLNYSSTQSSFVHNSTTKQLSDTSRPLMTNLVISPSNRSHSNDRETIKDTNSREVLCGSTITGKPIEVTTSFVNTIIPSSQRKICKQQESEVIKMKRREMQNVKMNSEQREEGYKDNSEEDQYNEKGDKSVFLETESVTVCRLLEAINCDDAAHLKLPPSNLRKGIDKDTESVNKSQKGDKSRLGLSASTTMSDPNRNSHRWLSVYNIKEETLRVHTTQKIVGMCLSSQIRDAEILHSISSKHSERHAQVTKRKLLKVETNLVRSYEQFLVNTHKREVAMHRHDTKQLNARAVKWSVPIVLMLVTRIFQQNIRIERAKEVLRKQFVTRYLAFLRKKKLREDRLLKIRQREERMTKIPMRCAVDVTTGISSSIPPTDVIRKAVPWFSQLPEAFLQMILRPAPEKEVLQHKCNIATSTKENTETRETDGNNDTRADTTSSNSSILNGPAIDGIMQKKCFLEGEYITFSGNPGENCYLLVNGAVECPTLFSNFSSFMGGVKPNESTRVLVSQQRRECRGLTAEFEGTKFLKTEMTENGIPIGAAYLGLDTSPTAQTDMSEFVEQLETIQRYAMKCNTSSYFRNASNESSPLRGQVANSLMRSRISQTNRDADHNMMYSPLGRKAARLSGTSSQVPIFTPVLTRKWTVLCRTLLITLEPYQHTFRAASSATLAAYYASQHEISRKDPSSTLTKYSDGMGVVHEGGADFWMISFHDFKNAYKRYFHGQYINLKALHRILEDRQVMSKAKDQNKAPHLGHLEDCTAEDEGDDKESLSEEPRNFPRLDCGTMMKSGSQSEMEKSEIENALQSIPKDPVQQEILATQLNSIAVGYERLLHAVDSRREANLLLYHRLTPEFVRKASPLFERWSEAGISALIARARPVVVRRDDTIVRTGKYGKKMILVVSGKLEVLLLNSPPKSSVSHLPIVTLNSNSRRIDIVREGEALGEITASMGIKRDPNIVVRALVDSDVWEVSQKDIEHVSIRENPVVLMGVYLSVINENGRERRIAAH